MTGCALFRPHYETASEHRTRTWVGAGLVVAACVVVPLLGGLATAAGIRSGWYDSLPKPAWTPPDAVFGPVWTTLYVMMAVAGVTVWLARDREDVCCPLAGFGLQLAANLAWSVLFFGAQSPTLAFLDVLVLWALVGLTTVHFFEVSPLAGWLMVPYWAWVTFAAALNAAIVALAA